MTQDRDPLVGTALSHYRILERLPGNGRDLYRVRGQESRPHPQDPQAPGDIVLELLPRDASTEAKGRCVEKAYRVAAFEEASVATLLDVDETVDGRLFLCWRWEAGESLHNRLGRGPMAMNQALWITQLVARGLTTIHQGGSCHGSLNPRHIRITEEGEVRLLDFGLRRLLEAHGEMPSPMALAYMAPEQVGGEVGDWRSDLWSLGVVLYEMLNASLPFTGDSAEALAQAILTEEPEPLALLATLLPEELDQLLDRTLAKDPARRYPGTKEVLAVIAALRRRIEPPPTASSSPPRRPPRPQATPTVEPEKPSLFGVVRRSPTAPKAPPPRLIDLYLTPSLTLLLLLLGAFFLWCR